MTIAAGFVNRSGVLLCADTLVGDSQQSSYRSKIIGSRFQDGEALFGYCGVLGFSESAIQRCADVLERYRGRPRTIPAIVDSIRKIWTSACRDSHGQQTSYDQIVMAVHSKEGREVALYYSSDGVLAQSTTGFECIGCGDFMCRHLLGGDVYCGLQADLQRVFELAMCCVARVKAAMPTAIGGNLMAANLGNDGALKLFAKLEIEWVEQYSLKFEQLASYAAFAFTEMAENSDAVFERVLKELNRESRSMREQWRAERARYGKGKFGMPPEEAYDLRYLFQQPIEEGKSSPESTTHDSQCPPASQE